MAYEQKDNTGSLFKNDKREKDTQAHARGSALIDGVRYWVDSWTNVAKDGSKYQSLKFKRAEERAKQIRNSYDDVEPQPVDDDLDSIPF